MMALPLILMMVNIVFSYNGDFPNRTITLSSTWKLCGLTFFPCLLFKFFCFVTVSSTCFLSGGVGTKVRSLSPNAFMLYEIFPANSAGDFPVELCGVAR